MKALIIITALTLAFTPIASAVEIINSTETKDTAVTTENVVEQIYIDANCVVVHEAARTMIGGEVINETRTGTINIKSTDVIVIPQDVYDWCAVNLGVTLPFEPGVEYNTVNYVLAACGIDVEAVKKAITQYKELTAAIAAAQAALGAPDIEE